MQLFVPLRNCLEEGSFGISQDFAPYESLMNHGDEFLDMARDRVSGTAEMPEEARCDSHEAWQDSTP
jgi:hypothetical protein